MITSVATIITAVAAVTLMVTACAAQKVATAAAITAASLAKVARNRYDACMAYDPEFYAAYQEYLAEPTVRESHDWVFQSIVRKPAFADVLDIGCGFSCEFYKNASKWAMMHCVGIDLNIPPPGNRRVTYVKANYRNMEFDDILDHFAPTAFVSLFSKMFGNDVFEVWKIFEKRKVN